MYTQQQVNSAKHAPFLSPITHLTQQYHLSAYFEIQILGISYKKDTLSQRFLTQEISQCEIIVHQHPMLNNLQCNHSQLYLSHEKQKFQKYGAIKNTLLLKQQESCFVEQKRIKIKKQQSLFVATSQLTIHFQPMQQFHPLHRQTIRQQKPWEQNVHLSSTIAHLTARPYRCGSQSQTQKSILVLGVMLVPSQLSCRRGKITY
eukprot:TRINITY_DN6030_c0_g1_i2.p2 TRINITY_DN6030_c0_g1~~TRINITY_DN6030_c0_g1_i2.p2  ORF type:complete len:203 (+),score=-8.58 TRINITY_DN6030_c0_g1_i2:415-1023(+)